MGHSDRLHALQGGVEPRGG